MLFLGYKVILVLERGALFVGPCTKVNSSFQGYNVRSPGCKARYVVYDLPCCPCTKVMLFVGYSVVLVRKKSICF
jgi:hypothetical protein